MSQTDQSMENPPVATQSAIRRVIAAASLGTLVEWFDFALYGAASALVFGPLFFPEQSQLAATLASFAVFAVGFFVRPVGGLIAAHVGDRVGRKPVLIATVTIMGCATVAVGLLPTYESIGIWAPVLLVAARMVQGMGAGAEFAGAVTAVSEYAPTHKRAFYTSFAQASVGAALALATGTFALLALIPREVLLDWAWRVPFLASGVIFFVAVYIRRRIEETPQFSQAKKTIEESVAEPIKIPVATAIKESPRPLLIGFMCGAGLNVCGYLLNTFAISYIVNTLELPATVGTIAVVVATASSALTIPFFGILADRIGRRAVFAGGALGMLLYIAPYFWLLQTGNVALIIIAMTVGYGLGQGAMLASQSAFLAELFPTRYRFTGIAFTRELNVMLLGGTTPFIATALIAAADGKPTLVLVYVAVALGITLLSLAMASPRRNAPVEDVKVVG